MVKAKLYNQKGEAKGEVDLNPAIFGVKANENLVHQVVVAQLSNRRSVLSHAKKRGEVRGGGKKPWAQKGTGRARAGSSRSPLWRGGGVTFGPSKERNFAKKVNKKMKTRALFMVLSDKAANNAIKILDKVEMPEIKTKILAKMMKDLSIARNGILVIDKMDKKVALASRNLPNFSVIAADSLNVYDLLTSGDILLTAGALARIEAVYLKK